MKDDATNIGEILRRGLVVAPAQIAAAANAQQEAPGAARLGETLIAQGALKSGELERALKIQRGMRSKSVMTQARAAEELLSRAFELLPRVA